MIAMMFTGLERFRRRKWGKEWGGHSIFVKVHKLWVPVLVLLWTHSKAFWAYSLFPMGLILVDKLIGRLRGKEPVELLRAVSPTKDVLHLTMRLASGRRFKFQAGQYIFLQAPGISAEWHPFTLSSSPEERTFSLHIRSGRTLLAPPPAQLSPWPTPPPQQQRSAAGGGGYRAMCGRSRCRSDMDWTYALRQMLLPEEGGRAKTFSRPGTLVSATSQFANDDPGKSRAISIPHTLFVDGPYGSASEEVFHFEVMVLVAAGIGVTPFASILKTLAKQAREDRLESPLKKVVFYWICRDDREFLSFKDVLVDILEDTSLAGIFELNTYITGEVNLKSVSADEKYNQYAGRPNWNRIGQSIGDSFPTSDVGVFLSSAGQTPSGSSWRR
ncbi:hypothetical protein EMIHUDRAFT_471024 [Emiliania huxleyi CCMP1516]|uniref:FAD-binding FR-type domain-containing protein n=2 Tax=Emiliania huxleyi TaxID=2903 RepID=A0A0D3IEL2_EMIH1|nr:hypothetical protein EMIHUDRAFT_471024 [Emiliania huxleyi CCMP1516]EOD09697.1 hypothetical protein EMIHUDRAFT_471024 [Emiliania huxleyi CCMP1516]|eukprot:XP_005762126.1 hypothetical protein EMIHUDRAFT_471024 [Emiliania huxleyi CCMP1516]